MSDSRHGPESEDDKRGAEDEEIDLRYRRYMSEHEIDDDLEDHLDSPAADGWSTERESQSPWWVKAGIAIVSILIVLSLLAGLAGPFFGSFSSDDSPNIEYVPANVVEVIDVRTIVVEIDDEVATVRYIGVEPLPLNSTWYDVGSAANQQLVADREVFLEADDVDRDEFGRLLRYVYVDQNMVNGLLVRNGIALPAEAKDGLERHDGFFQAWGEAAQFEKLGHWSGMPPQFSLSGTES